MTLIVTHVCVICNNGLEDSFGRKEFIEF